MNHQYKYICCIFSFLFICSCEPYGHLEDVETNGQIPIEQAYTDKKTIEAAVIGSYASMRKYIGIVSYLSAMGISGKKTVHSYGEDSFLNNAVSPNSRTVMETYAGLYRSIANADEIINKVPKTSLYDLSETEKNNIIGEATFIKALSYFYLLRMYGQFYDINAEYGIILGPTKLDSNNHPILKPRSSVKETYDEILSLLNIALETDIPETREASRISKRGIKGFKAKVLLYMNSYEQAANISSEFIDISLRETYIDIYKKAHTATDVLFASPTDYSRSNSQGGGFTTGIAPGSAYLESIHSIEKDSIRKSITSTTPQLLDITGFKWKFSYEFPPALLHLRLAEVVLIYAEAEARKTLINGGSIADIPMAVAQLNKVRKRVGLDPKVPTSIPEFLEMIRLEKAMELYYENGEDWFDLIRYQIAKDIDITTIKPTITNSSQYILPIPLDEIIQGQGVITQNPGY